MQKLRSDISKTKFMDPARSTMTAYRDYDFERRINDLSRLRHALSHFNSAVTQGMIAMKQITSALEAVGQAFTELTLGHASNIGEDAEEVNPFPTEEDMANLSAFNANRADTVSAATTRLTAETTSQVRQLAKLFAAETRRLNEGAPFQSFNTGVHRDVVTRLRPVSELIETTQDARHVRNEALLKYNRYKAEVEKVEKRYSKKGKPFCSSSTHKKYTTKRDEAWHDFEQRQEKFNNTFAMLMEVNDHAAAQIIHRYLSLNDEYLRQIGDSIGRILPAMEEAYPLNSEYSSMQNSLIVEAVAAGRVLQTDHGVASPTPSRAVSAVPGRPARDINTAQPAKGGGGDVPTDPTNTSSTSFQDHIDPNRDSPTAHSRPAEEPDEEQSRSENMDEVRMATGTTADRGYVLTQPLRLHTNADASSVLANTETIVPGTADEGDEETPTKQA